MKLDDIVEVYCTDYEKTTEGTIIGIRKDAIRVMLNGVPIWFQWMKTGVYVGNATGLEFIIKTNI
jgi:hypothetical protein|tara:strand:+ start:641 stop:835 length:195 start_codon:yes stop_codon:yes gene_type:complete